MAVEEIEITIEVECSDLPGEDWEGHRPLYLGIQRDKSMIDVVSAAANRAVFRAPVRVRRHDDGSANFLGPFAHGSRAERFIYLVWAILRTGVPVQMVGRIKLHLSHIKWVEVAKAARANVAIRVRLELTNAKGKPVMASVRPRVAKWELPPG